MATASTDLENRRKLSKTRELGPASRRRTLSWPGASTVYKNLNGVQDWPDWGSDFSEELSLDDDPFDFYRKYVKNLERGNPDSLCACGFPHLDYKCAKDDHDKQHCQKMLQYTQKPFALYSLIHIVLREGRGRRR